MSFSIPEFPLECDIYTGPWLTRALRLTSECNLALGRRVQESLIPVGVVFGYSPPTMQILLPAGTDVRDASTGAADYDIIECPSGSSRWYGVLGVDDAGKGFENEHRVVFVSKLYSQLDPAVLAGCVWPSPIP